jgi:hypothetical protein
MQGQGLDAGIGPPLMNSPKDSRNRTSPPIKKHGNSFTSMQNGQITNNIQRPLLNITTMRGNKSQILSTI